MGSVSDLQKRLLCLVAAFVSLLATGCSDEGGRRSVGIDHVALGYDSRLLLLSVESCQGEPTVTVEETDSEVRLTVEAYVQSFDEARGDCLDAAAAGLASPLGERAIIDTVQDEQLELGTPRLFVTPEGPVPLGEVGK